MTDLLAELNKNFAIEGFVSIKQKHCCKSGNLVYLDIKNKYCSATIHLQGAHLTAWTPVNNEAVIWLSEDAEFSVNKSIRGGIPICWPWFGAHEFQSKFPSHGFARTALWDLVKVEMLDSGDTLIVLSLPESNIPVLKWPYKTQLHCVFTIGKTLSIELNTNNLSSDKIVIGEALHSYFNISDINKIYIQGLHGCEYLDKLENFKCKKQSGNINIKTEVDRIYTGTNHDCIISDSGYKRRIHISKKSSCSTIVWNPWHVTAEKMADLGENGYLKMICVESGNVAQDVVVLEPNRKHNLSVSYRVSDIR